MGASLQKQIQVAKEKVKKQQQVVNNYLFDDEEKAEKAYLVLEQLQHKLERLVERQKELV